MILVSKLDELLQEKGMTAEQLADKADLPRMTIFNARRDKNITIINAFKIASILEVQVEQIWKTE